MPQNQCQLLHLLPLLAQLQQRRLSRTRIEDLSHPLQNLPLLLTQLAMVGTHHTRATGHAPARTSVIQRQLSTAPENLIHTIGRAIRVAILLRHAAIVLLLLLLLRYRSVRGSCCLRLGILVVRGLLRVLWVVLPVCRVGILVREGVLHGSPECVHAAAALKKEIGDSLGLVQWYTILRASGR